MSSRSVRRQREPRDDCSLRRLDMIDLGPATKTLGDLVRSVRDEQLDDPTPCPDMTVGDLVDHIRTLSGAFAAAARKDPSGPSGPPPTPDAANLGTGWREPIAGSL